MSGIRTECAANPEKVVLWSTGVSYVLVRVHVPGRGIISLALNPINISLRVGGAPYSQSGVRCRSGSERLSDAFGAGEAVYRSSS